MKGAPNPLYELEELRAILAKAALIGSDAELDVVPYPTGFARRSAYRRAHYLVRSKQTAVCHLIAGKSLERLHVRAKNFSTACPKLACRPLLYHAGKSADYLCLEHFSGESLDVAVQGGRCSAAEWLDTARRAQELLESTSQPSSPDRLQEEVDLLVKDAGTFPGFSNLDAQLLAELVRPLLQEVAADGPLVERWSTGDFVGRNLLVDAAGNLRLVDYEYAARTHFGRSDWLRLVQFSALPAGVDLATIKELQFAQRTAYEVYLWLHQLSLLREAEPSDELQQHIAFTVQNLFAAIQRENGRKSPAQAHSFLIGSLIDQKLVADAIVQQRTAWAKSLEVDLEKARAALATQAGLVEERSAWAKSLDQELRAARQNLEKLAAEYTERTTWAKLLETDLTKARAAHLQQAQLAARLGAELAALDNPCGALAALFPEGADRDRVAILEQSLRALVDLRRDVAAKNAAINAGIATTLGAKLDGEIAESDARRLAAALADAQLHVDGLLRHTEQLQQSINSLHGTQRETEAALGQKAEQLNASIAELQAVRTELARYETRLICRLAARKSQS